MTFLAAKAAHQSRSAALGEIRDVYRIRGLFVDEKGRQIRVEYDASRLKQTYIVFMLRNAGIRFHEPAVQTPIVHIPITRCYSNYLGRISQASETTPIDI